MDLRTPILALVVALGAGACSLADGSDTPSPPASDLGSSSASTRATEAERPVRRVDPRRGGLELGFGEFAITLEADEIRPGPVAFVVHNGGRLVHGFEIEIEEQGDSSGHGSGHDGLKLEGPAFGPGETIRIPTELGPGAYEIECFVAEHDDMGMRARLIVRRGAPLVREEQRLAGADQVEMADFAFSPTSLEVEVGSEVTWTNADPTAHTVTARDGSFDSETLDPGAGFATTFERVGTFAYFCQIHPTMRGSVNVVGSG
jgi:plastocyanin